MPDALSDDPVEVFLRDALRQQRVANTLSDDARERIRELVDEVVAQIGRHDPTDVAARRFQQHRINRIMEATEDLAADTYADWASETRKALAAFGRESSETSRSLLIASVGDENAGKVRGGLLTQNQIREIMDRNPFQGRVLSEWAEKQSADTVAAIRAELQRGMREGESMDQMVDRVRGRRRGRGRAGGVLQARERDARAIVRTAVTDIASQARQETLRRNQSITQAYRYVATLDSRTTFVCASLDGQQWAYDDPEARVPPQHFGCRSATAPVIRWEEAGLEPPPEGSRFARDPQTGQRLDVPASADYGDWLRRQPAEVMDDILGPERGRLFRAGEIGVRDLVRGDGSRVPVAELAA